MENAVEALKLAFAVILLTLALGLTMTLFSKARSTSDIVLRSADTSEYYDYIEYTDADKTGNRIVGFETIIPTLYKYSKENYKVTFAQGDYNPADGTILIRSKLEIYKTTTAPSSWNNGYINDFDGKNKDQNPSKSICSFDIAEELQRGEPWSGNSDEIKKHLDAIIQGTSYHPPLNDTNAYDIDYGKLPTKSVLPDLKNRKFVELIGKVTTKEDQTDSSGIKGTKTTTKMIITYVLITNETNINANDY